MSCFHNLSKLHIFGNSIGDSGVIMVLPYIKYFLPNIYFVSIFINIFLFKIIFLIDMKLTINSVGTIANCLESVNRTIKILDISNNNIIPDNTDSFERLIKNEKIRKIYIQSIYYS